MSEEKYYVHQPEGFYSFKTRKEVTEHIKDVAKRYKWNETQIREYIQIIRGEEMNLILVVESYHIGLSK